MPLLFYPRLLGNDIAVEGGGSSPPPAPALSVVDNANGTGATATIAGGDAGASNAVYTSPLPAALGSLSWTQKATIGGNNSGALSLANGLYLAYAEATEGGLCSLPSNTVVFRVTGGSTTALTQTPTGNLPVGTIGVAWLIASSANFQSLVGAANALEALERVAFPESDDTEESGLARPRAIVRLANEGFEERRVALNEFRPFMRFLVSLEALPPGGVLLESPRQVRLKDEDLWIKNLCQSILDDCKATEGIGTGYDSSRSQVSCSSIRLLDGPSAAPLEVRAEGELGETAEYFYGATFEFVIHG
ncbi:MAG TPA: hypothetical protein VG826_29220 [Pirellulales bacterium]|nr:hypothetical protein [Pirellulales bacterium]